MSIGASKCVVRKYCTQHWQRKWNITDSGRSTYELIPIVSQKPQLPSCRSTSVSVVRILLHESQLHRQCYRLPANTVQLCHCGHSVDDLEHFFLECQQYDKSRQELTSVIKDVWNNSEQSEKCSITVPLLLAPTVNSNLSTLDCQAILSCTFKFIQQSGRIL